MSDRGRVAGLALAGFLGMTGALKAQAPEEPLTLEPGDAIQLSVWPNAEFSGEFAVNESGVAFLPVMGAVRVAGMSIEDVRARIREGLSTIMQNPVVNVTPLFQVAVLGEVQRPGIYMATPTDQMFDLIAQAGGFTREADEEEVRLVREEQVIEVDALRALEQGELLQVQALTIRSGDYIYVPTGGGGISARTIWEIARTGLTVALLVDRLSEDNN